jgi:peptidoglycan LD-endopeptidase LytH
MSGSPRRASLVLLPLALAAACVVVESDAERDTPRGTDTAAGEVSVLDQPAIDTMVALGTSEAVDTLAVPPDRDTVAVSPTAEDLALLRAELAMPLEGIDPADIPDSFSEPRGTRTHLAIDIAAPRGTPVRSAARGRVMRLFSSEAGGLMVYAADSSERFVLMYAHLDGYAPGLADGAPLRRGDVIGFVGTTGNAPPNLPHLHFAIARTNDVTRWWTGTPVDPRPLLQP